MILSDGDRVLQIISNLLSKINSPTVIAAFQKKFGAPPDQWASIGYTIVKLYSRAIAGIKGPVTRQGVRDAIVATKNVPVVIGDGKTNFSFDAERNPVYKPIVLTIKDQKFIPAP